MEVRPIRIDEIEKLYVGAEMFFGASGFLRDFDRAHFKNQWSAFLLGGNGVIFVLDDDGDIFGALGALKFPDPNNGKLLATELFWFVYPERRGSGTLLLEAFEKWAAEAGCESVIMVYLTDSMPEIVSKIYERRGYRAMEVHYIKEL